jgi:amidase
MNLSHPLLTRLSAVALSALVLAAAAPSLRATEFNLQTASIEDIDKAFAAGALTSEKLVELCLARISAYDQKGPRLNAVIAVNPHALEIARALDAERKAKGPRGPLHGIPVVLKDNYDTTDVPTTGGSKALVGYVPARDAFTVERLRAAGAIIIAKVNLGELARNGVTISSLMGQSLNPYDLTRTPGGSSGGTGVAVAACFGIAGTGSDTGQSTRSPASANNGVGIRPTYGLVSRTGVIPISFTQDTAGPIAHYVTDAAIMLDAMAGFDPDDTSTFVGVGKKPATYTAFLKKDSLKGARIGYVTNLFGDGSFPEHAQVKAVTMKAIEAMKAAGATMIPMDIPETAYYAAHLGEISVSEFESKWMMDEYFRTRGASGKYHTLADYVAEAGESNPAVYAGFKKQVEAKEDALRSPEYLKRLTAQAKFRDLLVAAMEKDHLDALFYTHQKRLVVPAVKDPDQIERNGFMGSSTGLPAVTVQGGFSPATKDAPIGVPVGIEFLGRPFSEGRLLGLAYGYEQVSKHRTPAPSVPPLPGEKFTY